MGSPRKSPIHPRLSRSAVLVEFRQELRGGIMLMTVVSQRQKRQLLDQFDFSFAQGQVRMSDR
jgi:hypothetical protein